MQRNLAASAGHPSATVSDFRPRHGSALEHAVAELTASRVPGLSLAVVRRGERPVLLSAGVADVANQSPMTAETRVLWFSMTKIATATAAVQLADRGALNLGASVRAFVPSFPPPRSGADPTVGDLLSHTAGLANPLPLRWVHAAGTPGPDPERFTAELLDKHARLRRPAGTRAAYSNLGYIVLGDVIARAAGQSFVTYLSSEVLAPLGMARTSFHHDEPAATGHHPRLHPLTPVLRLVLPKGIIGERAGRWLRFAPFEVDGPAYGGLIGPVSDAARFLAMHLDDGAAILSPSAARSMRELSARGRQLRVGLGWFHRRRDPASPEPYVEHLGGGGGYWNMMRLYPGRGLGIVAMGNATNYDHNTIAQAVLQEFA